MKAAIYIRVGNKDQLAPETDNKKKEQEFENYCKRYNNGRLADTFRNSKVEDRC